MEAADKSINTISNSNTNNSYDNNTEHIITGTNTSATNNNINNPDTNQICSQGALLSQLQLQQQQQQQHHQPHQQQPFRQPPQKQQKQQQHMANLSVPQRTRRSKKKIKAQKYCVVCGDKAIACNFNATTCESCKAFFRRNAFKDNLKCVFDDQCTIDRVTRRFCSSCRLKKCFKNGMLKEWILSDEQKQLKRDKINDNKRLRSQLSFNNSGNESESTYDATPSQSIITKLEHCTNKDFSNILLTTTASPPSSSSSTTPNTTTTANPNNNNNNNNNDTALLYNNEDIKPNMAALLETNNIVPCYNNCCTDLSSHGQTIPYHMSDIDNNGCIAAANYINNHYHISSNSDMFGSAQMAPEPHHHHQATTSCCNFTTPLSDHSILCAGSPNQLYDETAGQMPMIQRQLVRLRLPHCQSVYRDSDDDSVSYSPVPKAVSRTPEELYNPEIALNPIVLCTDVKQLNGEWQEWETTLLNQLRESSNLLFMPIGEKFKVQTVKEMIAQTDYLLARLVKCMKKLSSFTTLLADDQVQILKSKCLSVLLLRSANVFEAMNESWNDADGNPNNKLALNWLKQQPRTEVLYNANRQFLMNFQEGLRYDKMIMILLAAILIFDTDSNKIHDRNALALRKARHIYLLMRYLHRNTNDPLGIRHYLMSIVLGMQTTVDSYLDFMHRETPSKEVYPLLCEFFDM